MTLYMVVSRDKYELPLIVADSAIELARRCEVTRSTIYVCIAREEAGGYWSRYKRVVVDDDEEENA